MALNGSSATIFGAQVSDAVAFLGTLALESSSTESLARRILLKSELGLEFGQDVVELRSRENADGGYGDYLNYDSNPLSTSFTLQGLRAAKAPANSTLQYLLNTQQSSGSWLFPNFGDSSNQTTAYALSALWQYRTDFNLTVALNSASSVLLSQRVNSGLWGDTETSALSLLAIVQNEVDRTPFQSAIDILVASQLANDSFQNDVYPTALIAR